MISIKNTLIDINSGVERYEEVYKNLQTLYSTIAGTVPFDREYGIDIEVLDNPIPLAKGMLTVEYIEKTRRYEPRANVKEVNFGGDSSSGLLIPRVVIEVDN